MPLSLRSPFKSPKAKAESEPTLKLESILVKPKSSSQTQQPHSEDYTNSSAPPIVEEKPDCPTAELRPKNLSFQTPLHPKYEWNPNPETTPLTTKPLNHIHPLGKAKPDRRKGLQGFEKKCKWCGYAICFWVREEWEAEERGRVHERECARNPGREMRGVEMKGEEEV